MSLEMTMASREKVAGDVVSGTEVVHQVRRGFWSWQIRANKGVIPIICIAIDSALIN